MTKRTYILALVSLHLFSMIVTSHAFSQDIDSLRVSCSYHQEPVKVILRELEEELPLRFHYKDYWVEGYVYTGQFTDIHVNSLLEKVLQGTGLVFYNIRNNIYLLPRFEVLSATGQTTGQSLKENGFGQSNVHVIGDPAEAGRYKVCRLNGLITEGGLGEPLIGATVSVLNTSLNTITGIKGNFTLELAPGNYELLVSSLGYEERKFDITVMSHGNLNIELFEKTLEISEVSVYAQRRDENVRGNQMSMITLDAKSIKQLPSIVGERDIVKSLTMSAGVKSVGEFGSGLNVRGGGEDQNLYLLEGSPLFNTAHVMGLLSVINPDAVSSVALYKGHIPAEYGERVSSVLNIQMKDFNIEKTRFRGGVGIFSSRLLVETPVFTNKVTLKIGGRTSYSDFLLKRIPYAHLNNSSASFYDLSGQLNINLGNDIITVSAYNSHNYFRYTDIFSNNYDNTLGSVNWSHIFSPDFSSRLSVAYSKYTVERQETSDPYFAYQVNSDINYLSPRLKFTYLGLNRHTIDFGVQAIQYNLNPGHRKPLENSYTAALETSAESGLEMAAYFNDVYELGPNTSIQVGLRYSRFAALGPGNVYSYEEGKPILPAYVSDSTLFDKGEIVADYGGFEPRLSVKQVINDQSSVKFSINRNIQYISLISYTSISTPEDTWKLADPYIKPVIANQLVLGYYRNLQNNDYETSVEAYYKQLDHVIEYRNGALLTLNQHLETELLNAVGYNYGIEFMGRKNTGKLTGTFTYTYSRSIRKTLSEDRNDQINRNELYPSPYDKPHDLATNLSYSLNRRVRFGLNFSYNTGRPITLPEYVYTTGVNQTVYYSDRNKYRLPDYHRLDLSISVDENLKHKRMWKGSWNFSVLNVYSRKNAYTIYYKREVPSIQNNFNNFSLYKLYLIGIPLPTLTYNFIF